MPSQRGICSDSSTWQNNFSPFLLSGVNVLSSNRRVLSTVHRSQRHASATSNVVVSFKSTRRDTDPIVLVAVGKAGVVPVPAPALAPAANTPKVGKGTATLCLQDGEAPAALGNAIQEAIACYCSTSPRVCHNLSSARLPRLKSSLPASQLFALKVVATPHRSQAANTTRCAGAGCRCV
jgi:hypothetical protein